MWSPRQSKIPGLPRRGVRRLRPRLPLALTPSQQLSRYTRPRPPPPHPRRLPLPLPVYLFPPHSTMMHHRGVRLLHRSLSRHLRRQVP